MTFGGEPLDECKDEELVGQVVVLDGNYFEGCRIERCEVHYAGGDWGYTRTQFINCRYVFSGRALFILESTASMMGYHHWEKLFEQVRSAPLPKAN